MAGVLLALAGCSGGGDGDTRDARSITLAMNANNVRDIAGAPHRRRGRCWIYYIEVGNDPYGDGREVCFKAGRVARILHVTHL